MTRWRSKTLTTLLLVCLVIPQMQAHDAPVHQKMTDYAYEVMLAMWQYEHDQAAMQPELKNLLKRLAEDNPALNALYADAAAAVPTLQALPSGLPDDPTPCLGPDEVLVLGTTPDWKLDSNSTLAETPLGSLHLAVSTDYANHTADCGFDVNWTPSGVLQGIIPASVKSGDHTGVTLGYWASTPDTLISDWVFRSTTLETLQSPAVSFAIGFGASALISVACAVICGLLPFLCAACPAIAAGGGIFVIDEIAGIDAEHIQDVDLFTGLGHFIDMKASPANEFDEKPGKLDERAGPNGQPDALELLVTAAYDLAGLHVNFAASDGPHHYEILQGNDAHANSIARTAADWETETAGHIFFTPVDNLAKFGWDKFVADKQLVFDTDKAHDLAWPLHALGDAGVPMHTLGTSGDGHRPFEETVSLKWHELVGSNDLDQSLATVKAVVLRSLAWRTFVQNWRAAHGNSSDVPIRDLVTALAKQTRSKSAAAPIVFNTGASVEYALGMKSTADSQYDNPAMAAIQRDLVIDSIAATLAFLTSTAEELP
jgi:hypothetical protein